MSDLYPPSTNPKYLRQLESDRICHRFATVVLLIATGILALGSVAALATGHELPCAALVVSAAISGHAALNMHSSAAVLRGLRAFAGDHASGRSYFAANLAHVREDGEQHLGIVLQATGQIDALNRRRSSH